jgi:uncharacterized lipoprotein YddW (UPF0748 family)
MFDNMAFWLFPRSVQCDDPRESASRMRDAGATHVFPYLSNPQASETFMPHHERRRQLDRLVEECRRAGLQVHGCFCEMKFTEQPDAWHQKREDGEQGALLCPANPEVADWILGRLTTFLDRYPLDGIDLEDSYLYQCTAMYDPANAVESDYRTIDVCFCEHCARHAPADPAGRRAYKEAAVTGLVRRISEECKGRRGLAMSAAARLPYGRDFYAPYREKIPYWDGWGHCASKLNFCADWVDWQTSGLLDFVCPMSYLHDTRIVELQTREARSRIPDPGHNVWMGLGLSYITAEWTQSRKPEDMNDAAKIREQLEMLNGLGQRNVVFFAYDREWVTDEHIAVMAAARRA